MSGSTWQALDSVPASPGVGQHHGADAGTPTRRRLYAALPQSLASPVLLAEDNIIKGPLAGGGWVVWAERDTVHDMTVLKANDGNGTHVLARAAEFHLLAFDDGPVAWWDGSRTRLWSPSSGHQVVATELLRAAITRRKLYAVFPDGALQGLSV